MVGDGHAMGVAAEILQHILGATEGTSQVDDPVLSKQWPEPSSEDLGFGEVLQVFGEAELPILEGLPEGRDELATKNLTQYRFGQEVVVRRADPAGVIERETSGGHHAMDMGMKPELLVPGVQHTEETNLCTEVSGIASDFEKSFRAGTKQEIVDHLFVLQHHWGQVAGECEDHVQVARGEQFSFTCGNPPFASSDLTLGQWRSRQLLYEIGARCAQRVHSSRCPPSAAVRHRAIASSTLTCFQRIHWRFRSTKAVPAVRMRSAISSAGGVTGAPPPQRDPHLYQNRWAITLRSLMRSVRRRPATSKRACIDWSGQPPGGRLRTLGSAKFSRAC